MLNDDSSPQARSHWAARQVTVQELEHFTWQVVEAPSHRTVDPAPTATVQVDPCVQSTVHPSVQKPPQLVRFMHMSEQAPPSPSLHVSTLNAHTPSDAHVQLPPSPPHSGAAGSPFPPHAAASSSEARTSPSSARMASRN
jgi:hypothetical protein